MEDIQKDYNISEYSVIQTTLEQIFNNFAIEAEFESGRRTDARTSSLSKKRRSSAKQYKKVATDEE